jgi:hypothetical protein
MAPTRRESLTKWLGSVVIACSVVFSSFVYVDSRYVRCEDMEHEKVQLTGAMAEQMNKQSAMFDRQLRILDQRQLDQLRISRSLLENELRRSPNDRLLQRDLETINRQIKEIEERLRQ